VDANDPKYDLRRRTKTFALCIVRLYTSLPKTTEAQVLGKQVLRSGTSVGAHFHEAKRARSTAEFVSKLGGALHELSETVYWLELLQDAGIRSPGEMRPIISEANELMAILTASSRTAQNSG
jgi:four helix bundle protein